MLQVRSQGPPGPAHFGNVLDNNDALARLRARERTQFHEDCPNPDSKAAIRERQA